MKTLKLLIFKQQQYELEWKAALYRLARNEFGAQTCRIGILPMLKRGSHTCRRIIKKIQNSSSCVYHTTRTITSKKEARHLSQVEISEEVAVASLEDDETIEILMDIKEGKTCAIT